MAMTRKITCVEVMQRGVKSFPLTYIPGKFVVFLAGGEENKKKMKLSLQVIYDGKKN